MPPDFIAAQIDAVFSDLDVGAVKIGMLSRAAAIAAVARGLDAPQGRRNIVLDPVMVATSGDRLLDADAVAALRRELIPRALVVTPNLPEAAALHRRAPARNEARDGQCRRASCSASARAHVLIKGGHGDGDGKRRSAGRARATSCGLTRATHCTRKNTHGTGCTLSSAIAAGLAKGLDARRGRARDAKAYVTAAIAAADRLAIGHGHGPLHHFHRLVVGRA